jgi:hypothetical protein
MFARINFSVTKKLPRFEHCTPDYFQDGIIPYFESIMLPLKNFLVLDEANPDSNVMFNQCLDTLAR